MLSRPLTLSEGDDRGRALALAPPPALPLAEADDSSQRLFPPAPPWSVSPSSPLPPLTPLPPRVSPSSPLPPRVSPSSPLPPHVSPSSPLPPHVSPSSPLPPHVSPSSPLPPRVSPSSPLPPHVSPSSPLPPRVSPSSPLPPRVSPSSPLPPWSSSPSSPLPPCASSSSSTPSLTLSFSAPPHPVSLPRSPSSSPASPSLLSPGRAPPSVSSARFVSPPPSETSPLPLVVPPPPPPPSSSSTPPTSTLRTPFSVCRLSSSYRSVAPSLYPSPPSLLSPPVPLSFSSTLLSPSIHTYPPFPSSPAPHRPLKYHHSSFISPPPPPFTSSVSSPSPPSVSFPTPHTSASPSPLSSSSVHVSPSLISPPPPAPPLLPHPLVSPPAAPAPSCPCSSLLPRLLSAHRVEVRRLLRGALASLGRRLDSLERRSRGRRRRRRRGAASPAASSSSSSCRPAPTPPATSCPSSPSSSEEDSPTPPPPCSLSQSEQRSRAEEEEEEGRGGKRRRKDRGEELSVSPERGGDEEEEEEDPGRFIGRMAVSFGGGGAEKEAPLTLHNFIQRKHTRREGGAGQSGKAADVIVRQNGYRAPLLLHSISSSSSQDALHLLQSAESVRTCSQSEAPGLSPGQWRFSDSLPLSLSSSRSAFRLWLRSYSASSFNPAPMLRLSAVTVETMMESVRGGVSVSPSRPLKDWTAPPSLSSDHCYVRTPTPSLAFSARRQQKQRANHSTRSLYPARRRPLPLPSCSANGLPAPFPPGQSAVSSEFLSSNRERGKRVSQIRIRRASPRETPLTPMGLPKVKRLKKKEFSLEEIYTNKNYRSPTTNRSLETIFEEPREKDGALLLIGQQRRRRLLLFPDFTQPRKRKRPQGVGIPVATVLRKRAAARRHCHGDGSMDDDADLDVMLVERLSALEDFLTRQGLDV